MSASFRQRLLLCRRSKTREGPLADLLGPNSNATLCRHANRSGERIRGRGERVKRFIDRRQFLGSAAAALAGAGLRPQGAAAHDAFSGYDGIGQAELVRSEQAMAL